MFAGMYEGSELKRANDAELDCALQQHSALRAETLAQLATVQATVTPFWWGLWILLRVRQLPSLNDRLLGACHPLFLGQRPISSMPFAVL